MWRFLQRLTRKGRNASPAEQTERGADEMLDLFASLREIEPDATARSEGRAKLRAALVTARAERSRPRLAGVRAFTIAVAGIAGSSVLVASAATGTDPVTLVTNVADWSVPVWDGSSDVVRESVTVESYDPATGILEGMTVDGAPVTLLLRQDGRDVATVDEPLERGTRIDVTIEEADDASAPSLVTVVEVVSTPPPDLAREPAPDEESRPAPAPEPTTVPHATEPAEPVETPPPDDPDQPTIATVEPAPTEPKDDGDVDPDTNIGALDPNPTRTPTPTAEPTPRPVEPVAPTPTPGPSTLDDIGSTSTNLEATEDGNEPKPDNGDALAH